MSSFSRDAPRVGRGAGSNPAGRFDAVDVEAVDDGWGSLDAELPPIETIVRPEPARSVISRNQSPDINFEQSINPYRGCEHGCIYCYARPSHAYLNLSPGLDFETKLFYKADAAKLLTEELADPKYVCKPITLGANTDPYQPIEREYRVTRDILETLARYKHPVAIVTKGALIERDAELLGEMARERLVHVYISVTTLDRELKRTLEPRAAAPEARLRAMRTLSAAGVPVGVMVAPVIPVLTDSELERILETSAASGARAAAYVLLRLPYELKDLFVEWLRNHAPLKADHVMARMREMRGGKENDPRFGSRMKGEGEFAELLRMRFKTACRRWGLNERARFEYNTTAFVRPKIGPEQLDLL